MELLPALQLIEAPAHQVLETGRLEGREEAQRAHGEGQHWWQR